MCHWSEVVQMLCDFPVREFLLSVWTLDRAVVTGGRRSVGKRVGWNIIICPNQWYYDLSIWKLAVKAPEKLGLGRLSFWDRLPVRYELLVLGTIISNRKWNNCFFGVNFFAPRFLFGSCWFDFSKNCFPPPKMFPLHWSMFFPLFGKLPVAVTWTS